jgi:hypothetical protein
MHRPPLRVPGSTTEPQDPQSGTRRTYLRDSLFHNGVRPNSTDCTFVTAFGS